ncbi:MAG: MarR family transcriptional regulator [Spirochaetes bacterium]|nr:MarR family transcriptional regulator [Spirochaetota bacterium]
MESLHPNDCLYYLVTRVSLSLTSLLKKRFKDAGYTFVKPAYIGVLLWLWMDDGMGNMLGKFGKDEGIKINDLGKLAGLEPSSMTGIIDRMEKDGLVMRMHDPKDRRAIIVQLTEKGITIRKDILAIMDAVTGEITSTIPPKQQDAAMDILKKILTHANK